MNIPRRVFGLLTSPAREWTIIARERDDVASLYRDYISILAAIPAVAVLVGLAISAGWFLGLAGITTALTATFMGYAFALAVPFAVSVALEQLAPRFKADGSGVRALKVVAYSSTPAWLVGVLYLFGGYSRVAMLVGLAYGTYLFYLGVTPVMEAPVDQRVPLTLVGVLTVLVINTLIGVIISTFKLPFYVF